MWWFYLAVSQQVQAIKIQLQSKNRTIWAATNFDLCLKHAILWSDALSMDALVDAQELFNVCSSRILDIA